MSSLISHLYYDCQSEHVIKCSFLEIYQENIYDLLDRSSMKLQLREDKRHVFVNGLKKVTVSTDEEAKHVSGIGGASSRAAICFSDNEIRGVLDLLDFLIIKINFFSLFILFFVRFVFI